MAPFLLPPLCCLSFFFAGKGGRKKGKIFEKNPDSFVLPIFLIFFEKKHLEHFTNKKFIYQQMMFLTFWRECDRGPFPRTRSKCL